MSEKMWNRSPIFIVTLVLIFCSCDVLTLDADTLADLKVKADQGDAAAQFILGVRYENGRGVPQDDAEAVKWYRKAADQGQADAQFNLGVRYENGRGVPQDYVQAHKWANLAAARRTGKDREKSVNLRDDLAARMTPAQIAEAQQLAREWRPAK